MNKLEINKDNYEGYIELYKLRKSFEDQKKLKVLPFLLIISLLTTIIFPLLFPSFIIGSSFMILFQVLITKYNKKNYNQVTNELKIRYPYVNLGILQLDLELALQQVHILSNNIINIWKYKQYLKCEEIKNEILSESKLYEVSNEPILTKKENKYSKCVLENNIYNNYLKCEEIKNELLNKNKYSSILYSPTVLNEELKNVKVKKHIKIKRL